MRAPRFRPNAGRSRQSTASPCSTAWSTQVDGGKDGIGKIEVALAGGARATLEADGLAVSGGWNPSVGLTSQHRGRPKWRDDIAAFVPDGAPAGMVAAGAANGAFSLADCLSEGHAAGAAAAADLGFGKSAGEAPSSDDNAAYALKPLWHVTGKKKAFVDFQNDVTASDVALAALEGFESVEHLKRYTTLGMATDQGKTSNVQGLAIMAELTGRSIPETGTTIYRPPYVPIAIGALAGHHRDENFHATRLTPVASLGGRARRGLRRHRPVEARAVVSCYRREGLAGIGDARGQGGAGAASASATSRRSARSTCMARMPAPSSTASTSTPSPTSPSARRATG